MLGTRAPVLGQTRGTAGDNTSLLSFDTGKGGGACCRARSQRGLGSRVWLLMNLSNQSTSRPVPALDLPIQAQTPGRSCRAVRPPGERAQRVCAVVGVAPRWATGLMKARGGLHTEATLLSFPEY